MKTQNPDEVLASLELDWAALIPILTPHLVRAAHEAGAELILRLGLDHDLFGKVAPSLALMARSRAAALVGKRIVGDRLIDNPDAKWRIDESTRDMLRTTVTTAIDEGWDAQTTRKAIVSSFGFSDARALMIARTERAWIQNHASHLTAVKSGVLKHKTWQTAGDEAVCEVCSDNADTTVPLESSFPSGDPFPPAHPNCSCTVDYG